MGEADILALEKAFAFAQNEGRHFQAHSLSHYHRHRGADSGLRARHGATHDQVFLALLPHGEPQLPHRDLRF